MTIHLFFGGRNSLSICIDKTRTIRWRDLVIVTRKKDFLFLFMAEECGGGEQRRGKSGVREEEGGVRRMG